MAKTIVMCLHRENYWMENSPLVLLVMVIAIK